jgi:hypothetical protein
MGANRFAGDICLRGRFERSPTYNTPACSHIRGSHSPTPLIPPRHACVCHVQQFRTGVNWDISPNANGTWKQGNTSAARIAATHSIKTVAEHSEVALHSCHGTFTADSDISGLRRRCQTFADPMRVGAPWLGEMPYIFLIIDLMVRWMQGLVVGEVVLPTFRSCNVLLFNNYQVRLYCHCHHVSFGFSKQYCRIQIHVANHGSLSSSQPISAAGLHVSIAHLLAVFRVPWLIIFRSRSTRRPAPSNCQRTIERTTKLAVSLIIFPHPSTFHPFSFAKWRQQKTTGPTQKGLATSLQFS